MWVQHQAVVVKHYTLRRHPGKLTGLLSILDLQLMYHFRLILGISDLQQQTESKQLSTECCITNNRYHETSQATRKGVYTGCAHGAWC